MYRPSDTGHAERTLPAGLRSLTEGRPRSEVLVFAEGDSTGVRQPVAFQCCPLGVQFYSRKKVERYHLLEFTMTFPGDEGEERHISCVGVVAGSGFDVDSSMYRICVKFLDVPAEARDQLEHMSRGAGLLCPYCENY